MRKHYINNFLTIWFTSFVCVMIFGAWRIQIYALCFVCISLYTPFQNEVTRSSSSVHTVKAGSQFFGGGVLKKITGERV